MDFMAVTTHHSCHILKKSSAVANTRFGQPFPAIPALTAATTRQKLPLEKKSDFGVTGGIYTVVVL